MNKQNIAILIFKDVEVLDFTGPYEVFSRTRLTPGIESRRGEDSAPFNVFTVAKGSETVYAIGGLKVIPDYSFETAPNIDILLVPGGFGTRALLNDAQTLDWVREVSNKTSLNTSVCTGALILAKLGLLSNKKATTHWGALEELAAVDNTINVLRDVRFVDDDIITSAGISAGIEMSLAVVEKMHGLDVARDTARFMEYHWDR